MIEANALYYFFSTVAQTFGAITGIVGMLLIYRLQQLSEQMKKLYSSDQSREKYGKEVIVKLQNRIDQSKDHFISFVLLNSFIILYSIIFLIFSSALEKTLSAWFIVSFLIFCVIVSLGLTINHCFYMIDNPWKDYVSRHFFKRIWLKLFGYNIFKKLKR